MLPNDNPTDPYAQDRIALLTIKELAEKAMSDNIASLKAHFADDFSIVTFSGRQFENVDTFITEWNKSREGYLKGGSFTVRIDPVPAIFSGDIAICRGDSVNVLAEGNGKVHRFNSPWSAVFRKQNGAWKIVRAHSSIDPFRNSIIRSATIKYLIAVGAVAMLAGLFIGSFIMWLFVN